GGGGGGGGGGSGGSGGGGGGGNPNPTSRVTPQQDTPQDPPQDPQRDTPEDTSTTLAPIPTFQDECGDVCLPGSPGGSPQLSATPELDSLALMGSGLLGLGGYALLRLRARRSLGSKRRRERLDPKDQDQPA
ncbi:MAG TPA: hypothetical protein VKV73_10750, partial [Chloroflexota bacterium]|nr:hypothetical protein [Chloroflexota bacterium]